MPTVRDPIGRPAGPGGNLGQVIAAYRRRRRQPHRDVPWSQEELAFACGTDQAHVSRIESGRQHPAYATLVRICDALELSQTERSHVLAIAGYQVASPLPDEAAVARVVARLAPVLDTSPYPVVLIDEGERQWYANALAVELWGQCYAARSHAEYLERTRGRWTAELVFDPAVGDERLSRWRAVYEDIDQVLMRIVALFQRAYHIHAGDPSVAAVLERLERNREFASLWRRVASGESDQLFIDHATYTVRNPTLGRLRLHAWRARAAVDERFIVTHFSPVDAPTSRVLERLADAQTGRIGPRAGL
jgi:transcriptional regulator with XRE-family HTH domain